MYWFLFFVFGGFGDCDCVVQNMLSKVAFFCTTVFIFTKFTKFDDEVLENTTLHNYNDNNTVSCSFVLSESCI